jgi:hypothetical protein
MNVKVGYFQQLAAACDQRAHEAEEEEVREFFLRMRNNWLKIASGLQDVEVDRFLQGLTSLGMPGAPQQRI